MAKKAGGPPKKRAGRRRKSRLTRKQSIFIVEYLVDLNATAAAKRAGYSAKSAHCQGYELLKNPIVFKKIEREMQARLQRTASNGDRVIEEAECYAFLDPINLLHDNLDLKALSEMPESARRSIAGFKIRHEYDDDGGKTATITEIKLVPKTHGIDKLGQHHGLWDGALKVEIDIGREIKEGRERAREDRERNG